MNVNVSIEKPQLSQIFSHSLIGLQIILGSVFLALMAQLSIPLPFTPVPLSMQPLAVFLLAITLGSRKAPLAVIAYLMQATYGLPVLAGGLSNPAWIIGFKAGYLIGFVVVAYLVTALIEKNKKSNFFKGWLIFSFGEITLLSCGVLWLSFFVGFKKAVLFGAVPFIPGALIEITIATCYLQSSDWLKSQIKKL